MLFLNATKISRFILKTKSKRKKSLKIFWEVIQLSHLEFCFSSQSINYHTSDKLMMTLILKHLLHLLMRKVEFPQGFIKPVRTIFSNCQSHLRNLSMSNFYTLCSSLSGVSSKVKFISELLMDIAV